MSNQRRYTTKGDIVSKAFDAMRISGLTVNASPEDMELALSALEDMMAEFEFKNVSVGWNFEDYPDANTPTNTNDSFNRSISTVLIGDLLLAFGKELTPQLQKKISGASSALATMTAKVRPMNYPNRMARGSGNLRYNRVERFYTRQQNPEQAGDMVPITWVGTVDNVLDLKKWLESDTAVSYLITHTDSYLTVNSDELSDNATEINLTVSCSDRAPQYQELKIKVTSSDGRVKSFCIIYETSEC